MSGAGSGNRFAGKPQATPFTYAQILASDKRGEDWRRAAKRLLGVDPDLDEATAQAEWREELQKARHYWLGPLASDAGD